MIKVLAFDYGASSGRAMLGCFDGEKITLEEMHRFSNDPVQVNDILYWDILRLFHELKTGIIQCKKNGNDDIKSIGIDTWGVDFGLVGKDGRLLENPVHYRDRRTDGMIEESFKSVSREEIYMRTGIQFMQFNTLYQLYALSRQNPGLLEKADKLLFTPDLMNYFLTGNMHSEYSMSSTSQMLNIHAGDWDRELLKKLGIPDHFLCGIIDSGTVVGSLQKQICEELGMESIPVIAVASHDTASAVISAPAETEPFAYLSSGTWSLLGTELRKPVVNEKTYSMDYSNEGGINRTIRLLKNIMGLWIYQECRNQWNREDQPMSFDELEDLARKESAFACLIDPDAQVFYHHGRMPEKIQEFCERTGQYVPVRKTEMVRCIMESLAMKYRYTYDRLQDIIGKPIETLHIVGGGCRNVMLSQYAANALGKKITTGPVEATAAGNVLGQLMALGEVRDIHHARKIIRNSFEIKTYEPEDVGRWNEKYRHFVDNIVGKE
ncbi:MAG: rhamnulokinase [Clostridia bacterium]